LTSPSLASFTIKDESQKRPEKKPSFGKRLLMSARSSLKSSNGTLVDSKPNHSKVDQVRVLSSSSAASIFAPKLDSGKNKKTAKEVGDIDFRKSKTSLTDVNSASNNLLIIDDHQHRSRRPSGFSILNDESNKYRSLTPNLIINKSTNRTNSNSAIDCCILSNNSAKTAQASHVNINPNNKDANSNFILKTKSPGPSPYRVAPNGRSPCRHHLQPIMRSVTPTSTTRIIFSDKCCKASPKLSVHSSANNSPIKLSAYCINSSSSGTFPTVPATTLSKDSQRSSSVVSLNSASRRQIPIIESTPTKSPTALTYKSACIISNQQAKSRDDETIVTNKFG
jgi:hypothetical protein